MTATNPFLRQEVAKPHYSEPEAADELGVSIEELRSLVNRYIIDGREDLARIPVTTFHASDLVVLKLLAGLTNIS